MAIEYATTTSILTVGVSGLGEATWLGVGSGSGLGLGLGLGLLGLGWLGSGLEQP